MPPSAPLPPQCNPFPLRPSPFVLQLTINNLRREKELLQGLLAGKGGANSDVMHELSRCTAEAEALRKENLKLQGLERTVGEQRAQLFTAQVEKENLLAAVKHADVLKSTLEQVRASWDGCGLESEHPTTHCRTWAVTSGVRLTGRGIERGESDCKSAHWQRSGWGTRSCSWRRPEVLGTEWHGLRGSSPPPPAPVLHTYLGLLQWPAHLSPQSNPIPQNTDG